MHSDLITDAVASEVLDDLGKNRKELSPAKALKLAVAREKLLQSLDAGDFTTLLPRVAGILNMYPDTRDSDVKLSLRYWETYQPDLFNEHGILPRNLFRLERMTQIVRARAKIQNEFGLFLAKEGTRRKRQAHQEKMQDAVIDLAAPTPSINIFADETGKTADWIVVAAVWVLDPRAVWDVTKAIKDWQAKSLWAKREIHFAKFGNRDFEPLTEYLAVVKANRDFLGFKFAGVEKAHTKRPIEETVQKLHEFMVLHGLKHEVESGRVKLPRVLKVTVDQENTLDKFASRETLERIAAGLQVHLGQDARIESFVTTPSQISALVQLADVIGGAINRQLNHNGPRSHKDDMADLVVQELGLDLVAEQVAGLDSTVMFYI
jgi:hypothetical protein